MFIALLVSALLSYLTIAGLLSCKLYWGVWQGQIHPRMTAARLAERHEEFEHWVEESDRGREWLVWPCLSPSHWYRILTYRVKPYEERK